MPRPMKISKRGAFTRGEIFRAKNIQKCEFWCKKYPKIWILMQNFFFYIFKAILKGLTTKYYHDWLIIMTNKLTSCTHWLWFLSLYQQLGFTKLGAWIRQECLLYYYKMNGISRNSFISFCHEIAIVTYLNLLSLVYM